MRLRVCENQVLILKELQRGDTVAYFRTDVNNPLARFARAGEELKACEREGRVSCRSPRTRHQGASEAYLFAGWPMPSTRLRGRKYPTRVPWSWPVRRSSS